MKFKISGDLQNCIMSDGYNAYVFFGDEFKSAQFKDTIHQVCMSHSCNKFVKSANHGGGPGAESFVCDMRNLFGNERDYDKAGLTAEERFRERQSLATKEKILIRIRSRLDSELSKAPKYRSYYSEALNS